MDGIPRCIDDLTQIDRAAPAPILVPKADIEVRIVFTDILRTNGLKKKRLLIRRYERASVVIGRTDAVFQFFGPFILTVLKS